jgi:surfeit locus 1 family protein
LAARDYSPKPGGLRATPVRLELAGRRLAPPVWAILLTLLGVFVFARLGLWQLDRAAYKQGLLDQFSARALSPPLDWAALTARKGDVAAYAVRLQGHYDNSLNVLLDNQLQDGVDGYHLLTAFRVNGGGVVLVDRGWVRASTDRRVLPALPPAQATEVTGKVALPSATFTVGAEDYTARPLKVLRLEPAAVSQALRVPLAPFVIRLDPAAADGFGRNWPPVVTPGFGPDKSRGYAFTWFSFLVLALILFFTLNLKKIDHEQ